MLIDTHAHLNFPDYQKDLGNVVSRAVKNEVTKIICVSSNVSDAQKAIEIAEQYPSVVSVAVGIHPQQTDPKNKQSLEKQVKILAELAAHKKVIAVGECGLDYSPAPPGEKDRTRKEQLFLFEAQIKVAQENKRPLLIHTRQAFIDTVKVLKQAGKVKGVFHCYSAGKKGIAPVDNLGFYFGVDGNLTYDQGLQNVFKLIPLGKILLETDCPFLSPQPYRGQRNEPKNIRIIAQFLAKLKGKSLKETARQTTQKAKDLFGF